MAPARIASTAIDTAVWAVSIRIGKAGRRSRIAAIRAAESNPGTQWSSTIASSAVPSGVPRVAIAVSASDAKIVRQPARDAIAPTSRRCAGSSSISISIRVPSCVIATPRRLSKEGSS